MSTKHKKPKARRMWANPYFVSIPKGDIVCFNNKLVCVTHPVAVLDVSDEAAILDLLVEEFIRGIAPDTASYHDGMRAALTALGVLPKRRGQ